MPQDDDPTVDQGGAGTPGASPAAAPPRRTPPAGAVTPWQSIVAIGLSLLIPGTGHLLIGRRRRALVFLGGSVLAIVFAGWLLSKGTVGILELLVQPRWVRGVIVANVFLGLFRVAAGLDVALITRPRLSRYLAAGVTAALLLVLVLPHLYVMTRSLSLLGVLEEVFPQEGHIAAAFELRRLAVEQARAEGSQGPVTTSPGTTTPGSSPDLPDGSVIPHFDDPGSPQLENIELNRITILLTGGDAGPGRGGLRTDVMIIASLDVNTGSGVLITVSRELTGFPLPTRVQGLDAVVSRQEAIWEDAVEAEVGGYSRATELLPEQRDPRIFLDRVNAIYGVTNTATGLYPNERRPGMAVLVESLNEALGIHIDYYVLVDFAGFVDLVDALGGVNITSRESMHIRMSPAKPGEEETVLEIEPGRVHLDGRSALVYVRNRTGSSDYWRTERQRCFVREVVAQVQASTVVSRFDRIARAIRNNAITNIPVVVLPDLIQVVAELDRSDIATMAVERGSLAPKSNYRGLRILDMPAAQAAVRNVLRGLSTGNTGLPNECGN